jgi:uncharacterized membrane protein
MPPDQKPANPSYPQPPPAGLGPVLDRNIEMLRQRARREEREAPWQERLAEAITRFTGSMTFVFIHLAVFGLWIVVNLGWIPVIPAWDETFVVLAMVASVEAIFLSTFVLISQNRMAASARKRADLDLQISLLTEHELTRIGGLVTKMAEQIGVAPQDRNELEELTRDVDPEAVLDVIERKEG